MGHLIVSCLQFQVLHVMLRVLLPFLFGDQTFYTNWWFHATIAESGKKEFKKPTYKKGVRRGKI